MGVKVGKSITPTFQTIIVLSFIVYVHYCIYYLFIEDVNIMGVIAAPNLTPIFQHQNKTPVESTEPKIWSTKKTDREGKPIYHFEASATINLYKP